MIRPCASVPIALGLALALAASAVEAQPTPAEPSILQPAGPAGARAAAPVAARPQSPAPLAPTAAELTAASEGQVRARFGAPDIARKEGAGALWTYRLKSCALFVFFRADDGRPLQVTGTAVGPRRQGQAALPLAACIAQFKDRGDPAKADDPIQAILDEPAAPQL